MEAWRKELYGELYHHGVKGQKWGVRRYQNADGSLTAKGRAKYKLDSGDRKHEAKGYKKALNAYDKYSSKLKSNYIRNAETARRYTLANKTDKAKKSSELAKEYEKRKAINDKQTQRLIDEASKKKYSVISKDAYRDTRTAGEKYVIPMLGGMYGVVTLNAYNESRYKDRYQAEYRGRMVRETPMAVVGKKYKVSAYG